MPLFEEMLILGFQEACRLDMSTPHAHLCGSSLGNMTRPAARACQLIGLRMLVGTLSGNHIHQKLLWIVPENPVRCLVLWLKFCQAD